MPPVPLGMIFQAHRYFFLASLGEVCCLRCVALLKGRPAPRDMSPDQREQELGSLLLGPTHVPYTMAMDRICVLLGTVIPADQWQDIRIEDLLHRTRHLRIIQA